MAKPACTFFPLKPALALAELRINYLGGISGLVAGNVIPICPLISCVTWRPRSLYPVSSSVTLFKLEEGWGWGEGSYRGQEGKGGYTKNNSFFTSSNIDCLNISLSLNGPHIFCWENSFLKTRKRKDFVSTSISISPNHFNSSLYLGSE